MILLTLLVGILIFDQTSLAKRRIPQFITERPILTPGPAIAFKQSRLCTGSNDGGPPYRYHKPTERCFIVGQRGPCAEMMEFAMIDLDYGTCECSQKLRCGRPVIYWVQDKRCYYMNDQGPCSKGKWLVFGLYRKPICKRNLCEAQMRQSPSRGRNFWFEFNGKCFKTGTQGYCSPNEHLLNHWRDYKPTCTSADIYMDCLQGQVHKTDCLPGTRADLTEECTINHWLKKSNRTEQFDKIPNIYALTLE